MPTKTKTRKTSKMTEEGTMLSKLCQEHGYMFMPCKPAERVTMAFDRKTNRIDGMYTLQLAVPMDSVLGKKMLEQYPVKKVKA